MIDTDILIDVARGYQAAISRLQAIEGVSILAISVITKMEMIAGCKDKRELDLPTVFLKRYNTIHIDEEVSETALSLVTQYRLSHGLHIPDALIAAASIVHNAPLLSKNQRDFRFMTSLKLLSYP